MNSEVITGNITPDNWLRGKVPSTVHTPTSAGESSE